MNRDVMFSSVREDWETPHDLFKRLDSEFTFTLDVCAHAVNAKCASFISKERDGLSQAWGGICWMNPPYGQQIKRWVKKAADEARRGATVVGLLPARTDTRWFHDHIYGKAEIRLLKGRLKFVGAEFNAPFPSMVVVWRPV